jgi:prolyl-tRNA synthetase
VLAESGEDAIVSCNSCDYAANVGRRIKKEPGGRDFEESPKLEKSRPLKEKRPRVASF